MEAVAFAPAHITGVFQIQDAKPDSISMGSRGAGVSLTHGVTTRVRAVPSHKEEYSIWINGVNADSACVSKWVACKFQEFTKERYAIKIEHDVQVPIGSGFGTSGAAGLGLSLALNDALNIGLTKIEAAQVAHEAEIFCGTGLGTVSGETFGGIDLRLREGAPGVGVIKQIKVNGENAITAQHFGDMSTERALKNLALRHKINSVSGKLIAALNNNRTLENFLRCSRWFSRTLGLMSRRVERAVIHASEHGYICTQAMFGDTVFTITKQNEVDEISRILAETNPGGRILTANIDVQGVRLI